MLAIIVAIFISILSIILLLISTSERVQAKRSLPHGIVKDYWAGKERRKFTRFKTALQVNYVVEKKLNGRSSCRTIDISEGGMRILIDEKLSKETILDLQILANSTQKIAHVKGEVVWTEEASDENDEGKRFFYVGIRFVTINEPHHKSLIEYVRSIATEDVMQVA